MTAPLLPATVELLRQFGDRLRLARLRRRLTAKQVAERAGMNPMTLRSLERGGSGVTIGAYLAVMQVLGIEKELDHLAQADPVGRSLQDARLTHMDLKPARVSHGATATAVDFTTRGAVASVPRRSVKKTKALTDRRSRNDNTGFVTSDELATLLTSSSKAKKR